MAIDAPAPPRIRGLVCRNCGTPEALGPNYVCAACFGPLEVAYDLDEVRRQVTPAAIATRRPGIWRYLELLPLDAAPERGLKVGSTPLIGASRLGASIGIEGLLIKDDTRNPTLSFKDRAVAIAAARLRASASRRWAARAPATSPARPPRPRPPSASRPSCSSPPTSSPPRSSTPSPTARRSSASTAPTTTSTACASRSPTSCRGASSTSTSARSTPRAARRSATRSPRTWAGACPT